MDRERARRRGRNWQVVVALVAACALIVARPQAQGAAPAPPPLPEIHTPAELERWIASDPPPTKAELGIFAKRWFDALGAADRAERERLHDLLMVVLPALELAGAKASYCAFLALKIGEARTELGRHEDARQWLAAAAERCAPGETYLPWMLVTLADNERELRRWDEAAAHLARAREIVGVPADVGAKALLGYWLRTRASFDRQLGLHDRARAALDEAARLAAEVGDPVAARSTLEERIKLAHATDDYGGLRRMEAEWPAVALAAGSVPERERWRDAVLALAYAEEERVSGTPTRARGDELERLAADERLPLDWRTKLALGAASHALLLHDDAGARRMLESLQPRLSAGSADVADLRTNVSAYAALRARVAIDAPDPSHAAEERARTLAELETAFDEFLGAWERAPMLASGIGYLHITSRHVVASELIHAYLAEHSTKRAWDALDVVLRMQALGTLARALEAPACRVAEVRELVARSRGVALVYAPGKYQTHLFVVTADGISAHELPAIARIDALRRRLAKEIGAALRAPAGSSGDALADAVGRVSAAVLPPDVRASLADRGAVQIVGVDGLGYVPFELIALDDGGLLGERCAVSYLPSFPVALALRRAGIEPAQQPALVLVAASSQSSDVLARHGLDALEIDPDALRAIVAPYGTAASALVAGDATRATLDVPRDTILHVIAHGLYDDARDLPAGLLLASRGTTSAEFWTEDVSERAPPRLVILSACGPWRAPLRRGDDGRGNLAGAFLARGAQTVVASYVDQELTATVALSKELHAALAAGETTAEALRRARLAASGGRGGDPLRSARCGGLVHAIGLAQEPLFVATTAASAPGAAASATLAARTGVIVASAFIVALLVAVALVARARRSKTADAPVGS